MQACREGNHTAGVRSSPHGPTTMCRDPWVRVLRTALVLLGTLTFAGCQSARFDIGENQKPFGIGELVIVEEGGFLRSDTLGRRVYAPAVPELTAWEGQLAPQTIAGGLEASDLNLDASGSKDVIVG